MHGIGILWTILGAIQAIYTCNQMDSGKADYNTHGSVPPKGNDHLEEAMEKLNQKIPHLAKGFHMDTIVSFDHAREMQIQSIIPSSDLPELKLAHELLKTFADVEALLFISSLKPAPIESERLQRSRTNTISMTPVKMFFGVGRLSYLFKQEARGANGNTTAEKWLVFNYDLVNKKRVNFQDFFDLKSDSHKKRFLETLTGKSNTMSESDLDKVNDFSFFFNKSEIVFIFNSDHYPFDAYVPSMLTIKHDKLREFIKSRFQTTYLEARP